MSRMHHPVRIAIGASLLGTLLTATAASQTLPELFQKMKGEVNARSWADALRTLATLQNEAGKPGNEEQRDKLEAPIAFYRGVCEASLGQSEDAVEDFATFLAMQPDSTIDSAVYSGSVVAAFDQARKVVVGRAPSLAEAYRLFRPPRGAGRDPADKFWAEGPARWILTDEEKKDWSSLTDPNAQETFVETFWTARESLPGAGGRTFREEFERRVAFADEFLSQDAERRGSLTDRGMVFVLLGPPKYAGRTALRSGDELSNAGMSRIESQEVSLGMKGKSSAAASALKWDWLHRPEHRATPTDDEFLETWHYGIDQLPAGIPYVQVDVHYVTKRGAGRHVLQLGDTPARRTIDAARRQAMPRATSPRG